MNGKLLAVPDTGPKLQGAHKGLDMLASGVGFENGEPVLITKPYTLEDLLDCSPREGMAIVQVLRAIAGPDSKIQTPEAVCNRLDAFTAQADASYQIPAHRRRSKQATSAAAAQVFKNLGIDRILTARSRPKIQREHMAEAQRQRWKGIKNPDAANAGADEQRLANESAPITGESNAGGQS